MSRSSHLTPRVATEGARRLVALVAAASVLSLAVFLAHRLIQPTLPVVEDSIVRLLLLATVLAGAAIVALHRYRLVPEQTLLTYGAAFELLIAFMIAMTESAVPLDADATVRGISLVSVWIVAFGLLIPAWSSWSLAMPLAAATMWPVAYAINQARFPFGPAPWSALVVWVGVNYVVALFTLAAQRYLSGAREASEDSRNIGSYTLVSRIGEGGMGEVWRAKHHLLAREAAVKIVGRQTMAAMSVHEASVALKRFRREANATAGLESPQTVRLYDFGVSEAGDFYYVMELLDGIDLQSLVGTFGPQPASRVVAILKQVCESLEEAHTSGLVHRDLKPSNVMVCKVALAYDQVKVLDFGLVKPARRADTSLVTVEGVFGGTPGYIAPEVALGETQVDGRADLYGLGAVAYFLLTGSLVFPDLNEPGGVLRYLQSLPDPPSQRTDLPIPPALDRIVLDCLEKLPEKRPASARELASRLDGCGVPSWTAADAEDWWRQHVPREATAAAVP